MENFQREFPEGDVDAMLQGIKNEMESQGVEQSFLVSYHRPHFEAPLLLKHIFDTFLNKHCPLVGPDFALQVVELAERFGEDAISKEYGISEEEQNRIAQYASLWHTHIDVT